MGALVDTKELKRLIKLLKDQGVVQYSTPTITLVLDPKFQPRVYKDAPPPSESFQDSILPKLSQDELLFWSSAGLPDEEVE